MSVVQHDLQVQVAHWYFAKQPDGGIHTDSSLSPTCEEDQGHDKNHGECTRDDICNVGYGAILA
jgi:hypothetical protein